MKPKRAKNEIVTAAQAALKRRSKKSVTSSIGCAAARSTRTNQTASPAAAAKPTSVDTLDQPCSGASMIVHVRVPSAATEIAMPGRSSGGTPGSRDRAGALATLLLAIDRALGAGGDWPELAGPRPAA